MLVTLVRDIADGFLIKYYQYSNDVSIEFDQAKYFDFYHTVKAL